MFLHDRNTDGDFFRTAVAAAALHPAITRTASSSRLHRLVAARRRSTGMVQANRSHFTNGVVHSFTGTWAECEKLLELGLYIGLNGWCVSGEEPCPKDRVNT